MRRRGVTTMVAVTAVGAMLAACGDATREVLTDDAVDRCARLSTLSVPATAITDAVLVDAHDAVPEHCRVEGQVETLGAGNVDSNRVAFQVGLPTEWNGDFHFQGLGGFAGHLGSLDTGLSRGYASATTDTGHRGSAELQAKPEYDGSWALNNRPRQIDYAYRGTHVATVAAKAVAGAYYGNEPRYSIFSGCSNGGRHGLMEAQRYPDDYDGIIANSPAISVIDVLITWIWQVQAQLATLTPGCHRAISPRCPKRQFGTAIRRMDSPTASSGIREQWRQMSIPSASPIRSHLLNSPPRKRSTWVRARSTAIWRSRATQSATRRAGPLS